MTSTQIAALPLLTLWAFVTAGYAFAWTAAPWGLMFVLTGFYLPVSIAVAQIGYESFTK
jgi:hypothetical protein